MNYIKHTSPEEEDINVAGVGAAEVDLYKNYCIHKADVLAVDYNTNLLTVEAPVPLVPPLEGDPVMTEFENVLFVCQTDRDYTGYIDAGMTPPGEAADWMENAAYCLIEEEEVLFFRHLSDETMNFAVPYTDENGLDKWGNCPGTTYNRYALIIIQVENWGPTFIADRGPVHWAYVWDIDNKERARILTPDGSSEIPMPCLLADLEDWYSNRISVATTKKTTSWIQGDHQEKPEIWVYGGVWHVYDWTITDDEWFYTTPADGLTLSRECEGDYDTGAVSYFEMSYADCGTPGHPDLQNTYAYGSCLIPDRYEGSYPSVYSFDAVQLGLECRYSYGRLYFTGGPDLFVRCRFEGEAFEPLHGCDASAPRHCEAQTTLRYETPTQTLSYELTPQYKDRDAGGVFRDHWRLWGVEWHALSHPPAWFYEDTYRNYSFILLWHWVGWHEGNVSGWSSTSATSGRNFNVPRAFANYDFEDGVYDEFWTYEEEMSDDLWSIISNWISQPNDDGLNCTTGGATFSYRYLDAYDEEVPEWAQQNSEPGTQLITMPFDVRSIKFEE